MRATIVIPSYWGRALSEPFNIEDEVYDHPTSLDEEGTLKRALESIDSLSNRDFNVVVIAAATSPEIAAAVEEKVRLIVEPFRDLYPATCISHTFEDRLRELVSGATSDSHGELVSLTGYSNIRNMCLIAAELAGSEVAVLFDDDEVYEDCGYLDKVFENIGREHQGRFVGAIAGYYLQPEGGYLLDPPEGWWMAEWPMVPAMNEAFQIIGREPRLEVTPFVFGGNMVIHRDVYRLVAFDPNVRRGEDIDYLVNCKFFDIDFLLDNQLSIKHLPPRTSVPPWQHFRENIYRFIYSRAKLRMQSSSRGLRMVHKQELEPYPGRCIGDDLEDLIFKTSVLIGLHHMEEGDRRGFEESMRNIYLARYDAPPDFDPFEWYLGFQPLWKELMDFLTAEKPLADGLFGDE